MEILSTSKNRLLALLPGEDLALLEANLHRVSLPFKSEIEAPNIPIESCYFLTEGIASVVASSKNGKRIEVGLIGREGVTGAAAILGSVSSPNATFMQVPGAGFRISAIDLRQAMERSRPLASILAKFVHSFMVQNGQTALVNGKATLEERLARWILMAHDRVETPNFSITHEFLAVMLGVRRPGVTTALHDLEGRGLIRSKRGEVIVLDRSGIEEVAGWSYGTAEAEYQRLYGRPSNSQSGVL